MTSGGGCQECAICMWCGNGPCPTHGWGHMIWDEAHTARDDDDDTEGRECDPDEGHLDKRKRIIGTFGELYNITVQQWDDIVSGAKQSLKTGIKIALEQEITEGRWEVIAIYNGQKEND